MDSCYSGLALSRGGGAFSRDRSYLEEITRRTSRLILTAGGADQQVADDGPNGRSVFTWALLQGLQARRTWMATASSPPPNVSIR